MAILRAAPLCYRSGAVFYPYRQSSNLLYLTGFSEPESLAVIRKTGPDPADHQFTLFVRPKDRQTEQWQGPWSGVAAAADVFQAHRAEDIKSVDAVLPDLLKDASAVYIDGDVEFADSLGGQEARSLAPLVHSLRAIKSKAEIANLRRAGQISGRAFTSAMRKSWSSERDLAAYLDYTFVTNGCDGPAYIPVVAGGFRGEMIHYVQNNALLRDGEMVLVDAGGEYGTYIADITRTWPLGGKFTPAQRDLYEAVLKVQRTSLSLCRASASLSLDQIHAVTTEGLARELGKLGFDTSARAMDVLFPHHVSHYIGLDVHDVPDYPRNIPLAAGHCVTVEPGVYVPNDERWPEHFRGLSVRIEDSVCVDDEDPYILTTEAVKEVVDIEALREGGLGVTV